MTGRRVVRMGPGRTLPDDAAFVGRPTFLGNPFMIGRDGDRQAVVDRYWDWFHEQVKEPSFAARVRIYCGDWDLACFCAPERCHAEVIREWLDG